MRIEILNAEQVEVQALEKAIERAKRYSESADHIEIHCQLRGQRDFPYWLEYTICIYNHEEDKAPSFVIGMIQRSLTDAFEFHS